MDTHLRRAPFGVLAVAPDGTVEAANDAAADLLSSTPDALTGVDVTEAMPASTGDGLSGVFDGASTSDSAFEEYYPAIDRWLAVDVVSAEDGAVVYLRDRTDAHDRESELDGLRRRLDLTEDIDTLIAQTLRTVIDAEDRDAVARTVCEGLGTADRYEFAWVGETDPTGEGLHVVASAGQLPDLTDSIRQHLEHPPDIESVIEADHSDSPGGTDTDIGTDTGDGTGDSLGSAPSLIEWRAVQSGTTTVTESLAADESIPEDVRTAAFSRGLQSAIAVPLAHGGTVFGVLGVYLTRATGLSELERSSLETLGAVAGHAIKASRREDLLFSDTVTEITLRVDDESLPLVRAARAADATLTVVGVVPQSQSTGDNGAGADPDGAPDDAGLGTSVSSPSMTDDTTAGEIAVVCYLRTDAEANPVLRALRTHEAAADPRTIEGEQSGLIEVTLTAQTPLTVLAEWGATIRSGTVDGEGYQLVTAVSTDVETRKLLEAVNEVATDITVDAKTEQPRSPRRVDGFRSDLEAALTDRQRTVLRTAYLSEYFASPRGSSAEDVAEALDITGPTVLYHLRRAQRKLLNAFFADDDDPVSQS